LKDFVATGATDAEMADWITRVSSVRDPMAIIRWNNKLRDMRLPEMGDEAGSAWKSTSTNTCPNTARCTSGSTFTTWRRDASNPHRPMASAGAI